MSSRRMLSSRRVITSRPGAQEKIRRVVRHNSGGLGDSGGYGERFEY